ncbi:DUF2336 domain-containing protein [Rhodopseudomonas palustris]|uniref:DUF2336 domain-containing protein n=1 Tax=Rhodopseudomonas palustris (strain BisB5) TaxID=316057 RepID=Q139Q7_RHOPS|nr:conserved hypothetical protein [Rhodopseudomonas palustris BisB5]MBB1091756.1 DUF2336 domain-containing protein [Rhodopseudomonas palustris]
MITPAPFPGFDGLMALSHREGVDIRPTLLRVLTDLYVQSASHTREEEQQFVELTSRLIDEVDDATRAVVRARLSIYPHTPPAIAMRLALRTSAEQRVPQAAKIDVASFEQPARSARPPTDAEQRAASLQMQPEDAAQLNEMFFAASTRERTLILHNLAEAPLRPAARIYAPRAARAIETLHMAAYASDAENFTRELGDALILSTNTAERVVADSSGEPLACAMKALDMPGPVFEQVLMFLDPELGASVDRVYRLSRLYDRLGERTALIMLAAWRGATVATARAKYRSALYDDERHRARAATPQSGRPAVQPGSAMPTRTGTDR